MVVGSTAGPARYLGVTQARGAGYKGDIVLGWDYVNEAFWKATGKHGVGVIWPTFSSPTLAPDIRGRRPSSRLFTKRYKHAPLIYQAFTWDQLNAWKWAVETAGSIAPADVIPVLPRIDMQGTMGHITLSNQPGTVHFNQWEGVTVYFDQATKQGATDATAKVMCEHQGRTPPRHLRPCRIARSGSTRRSRADEPAAPPLEGAARADVAIMGGGYAGLWTAIRIKQREPSCDVVVLEQDICGGGASGRNGGFAISWWAKLGTLVAAVRHRRRARARARLRGRPSTRSARSATSTASTRTTTAAGTSGRPRRRPSSAPGTASWRPAASSA